MEDLSAFSAKPRLRLLLDHFSKIKDRRQAWKVAYPLCGFCSWRCAGRSQTATTMTISSIGAGRICRFCAALPSSTTAFHAPIGCKRRSTAGRRPFLRVAESERAPPGAFLTGLDMPLISCRA